MVKYDLVIVGAGASGISAGIAALKNGIKNVLIIDRRNDLGGNLNIFIHKGFGRYYLGEDVTGPELSTNLIKDYKALGGLYKLNTEVLEISKNKLISYVNPEDGINEIEADSIIIASGCRERFTGNIDIPIHKYGGIYTLFSAHRLVNIQGFLPGKYIVISGLSKWSLILARRLLIEGANSCIIIDNLECNSLKDEDYEIINGFNVNIIKGYSIDELNGKEKIESIDIIDLTSLKIENIKCDALILKIGYYPDISFIRESDILLKEDTNLPIDNYKTSIDGVFACGTVLLGEEAITSSGKCGLRVGKAVADYLNNKA